MASLQKKIIALFLVSFFTISACQKDSDKIEEAYSPQVATIQIKPGLQQEFAITGQVFAHQISRITSEQRGKVDSIFVKVGDTVSKGQNLISLSSPYVSSAFNAAGSTLRNAQINVEQTQLSVQKNIEAVEIALETAQTNLENTLRQSSTFRKQAEETLNAAKLNVELGVSSAQTGVDNAIRNGLPAVQSSLLACDKILGVSDIYRYVNDIFENNLGAFNTRTKTEAEHALRNAQSLWASFSESYENASRLFAATEDALQKTLTVLNNSVTGTNYPAEILAADIEATTTQLASMRTVTSALEAAKTELEIAEQEGMDSKPQSILNAEAAYEATIAQLETNEDSARKAVESAQNALENAKRSAELSQLSARSSLTTAFGTYDQARISKEKLIVQAPFDGKVVEIYVKKSQEVNPGFPLIIVEDDSELSIVAYLSSNDAQKIRIGDDVTINYGQASTITSISPSADPITKKYKVEIGYQNGVPKETDEQLLALRPSAPSKNSDLIPGELVKLAFKTDETVDYDRIFVPLPSLHILQNEIFVWKVENEQTVKNPVLIGEIEGDYVEILRGLSIGDEIIVEGGRLIEKEGVKVEIINQPLELPENDKT